MSIITGIGWHLVGAASAAGFYVPFKKVKNWSWESMWILGGLFSWVLMPWLVTYFLVPDWGEYYSHIPNATIITMMLFGAMWGIGNITYGLTMRYLGISLGIGIAIGLNLAVGTLLPPILKGEFGVLLHSKGSTMTMLGIAVALVGIVIVSMAGNRKEKEISATVEDFNLKKGVILAIICGIFSAGFAFGLDASGPISAESTRIGINPLYVVLPGYGFIMGGGAIVNFAFCIFNLVTRKELSFKADLSVAKNIMIPNIIFAALGGIMWYFQFFFYGWGQASIPKDLAFINWMLHMSGYVFFGGVFGLLLNEWKGVSKKTIRILLLGLLVIIISADIVGIGMMS